MPVNDTCNRGKANPSPFEFIVGVQSLKGAEELVRIGHVEARTVIAHEKHRTPLLAHRSELDTSHRSALRELPCIPKEVLKNDAEESLVSFREESLGDIDIHLAVRLS